MHHTSKGSFPSSSPPHVLASPFSFKYIAPFVVIRILGLAVYEHHCQLFGQFWTSIKFVYNSLQFKFWPILDINNQEFPCLQQFTYYPLTDSTPNIKEYFKIFDLEYPCQKKALSTQQHDQHTCSSNYVHVQLVMLIMMWTHKIVEKQSKMSWWMRNISKGQCGKRPIPFLVP